MARKIEDPIELVRQHLGDVAAAQLSKKLEDANRLSVIRDAFLTGTAEKDMLAIEMIRDLDKRSKVLAGDFMLCPISIEGIVAAASSAMVVARPQASAFRPVALLVSHRSRDFMITDIRVGNRSQIVQAGDLPADIFTPLPPELETFLDASAGNEPKFKMAIKADVLSRAIIPLDMDTCQTAQDLSMIVYNPMGEALHWKAAFLGKTPKDFR